MRVVSMVAWSAASKVERLAAMRVVSMVDSRVA